MLFGMSLPQAVLRRDYALISNVHDVPHFPYQPPLCPRDECYTVRRSLMTLTILPAPAISTHFSCQLNSTLIAWLPLSTPLPMFLPPICENPVGCGVMRGFVGVELAVERPSVVEEDVAAVCEADMPLYLWKMC